MNFLQPIYNVLPIIIIRLIVLIVSYSKLAIDKFYDEAVDIGGRTASLRAVIIIIIISSSSSSIFNVA